MTGCDRVIIGIGGDAWNLLVNGYYRLTSRFPLFTYSCTLHQLENSMIWHMDIQYLFPGIEGVLSPYWWTNRYSWVQASATSPDPDGVGAARAFSYAYCSGVVFRELYRVRNADATYDVKTYDVRQGLYGSSGSFYSQYLWFCLLRGLDSSGRMVAYKRLRGGWDERYVSGNRLSTATTAYVEHWLDTLIRAYPYTSYTGQSVVSWVFDPTLRLWQRRHGSKRATRPVIAYP